MSSGTQGVQKRYSVGALSTGSDINNGSFEFGTLSCDKKDPEVVEAVLFFRDHGTCTYKYNNNTTG
jgi:hypothetical protein